MGDSSDDDYELPSLSDRVQAFYKPKNLLQIFTSSDSESDEKEFLKFSEKIRNTPSSAIKQCDAGRTDSAEIPERLCIPKVQSLQMTSDSESDESDFLKFSHRIRNTPQTNIKDNPKKSNVCKQSILGTPSPSAHKQLKRKKSLIKNKVNCREASESDSDDSFYTPLKLAKTPKPLIGENCKEENESDSDDSFFTPFKLPKTPKSLISTGKKMSSSPKEKNEFSRENNETRGCLSVTQIENEKEFKALFPPNTVNSSFLRDRVLYSKKLYDFFNRKIFQSELPGEMRLEWDESLLVTAGSTCCSRRNDIYTCYIRLSSKLLTSFDRLRDTLLHEMCHAAVWLIGRRSEHHGPLWRIWASRCKLILPCLDVPERCHTYDIAYRVWYTCPSCKRKIGRCKQSRKFQNGLCGRCKVPFVVTTNQ